MTKSTNLRQAARRLAIKALYASELGGDSIEVAREDAMSHFSEEKYDQNYFTEILSGLTENMNDIDGQITLYISRTIKEVNPIELSILRVAFFELCHCPGTPYKVIINEAIEMAKSYGADKSHKFINGVLDKASKTIRPPK